MENLTKRTWKPNPEAAKELRRVLRQIRREPRKFDMASFVDYVQMSTPRDLRPPCGTTACLAGHIALNQYRDKHEGVFPDRHRLCVLHESAERVAMRVLHMPPGAANILFYDGSWPEQYQESYIANPRSVADLKHNVEVASKFVRQVIRKGLEY